MDLDAIAVFVKVVEVGSFSGAARLLKMPKTTVSAKVAGLEKRLGVTLIQRTTRKLHITEAGEQYFHHCAQAVREIELGEAALLANKNKPTGLLRVTAPLDFGHAMLPGITRAYLEAYPGTSVEMILSNRLVDLVGEGVDLAIRAGSLQGSSLIAKRFFNAQLTLWAAPAYLLEAGRPRHPRDLKRHRVVGMSAFKSLRLTNDKSEVELEPSGRVVTDDFDAIKSMLILGEGIGWLPDFLATDAAAAGTLAPVLPGWRVKSAGGFSFVYPGKKYASPKVQAFIQSALAFMAAAAL